MFSFKMVQAFIMISIFQPTSKTFGPFECLRVLQFMNEFGANCARFGKWYKIVFVRDVEWGFELVFSREHHLWPTHFIRRKGNENMWTFFSVGFLVSNGMVSVRLPFYFS